MKEKNAALCRDAATPGAAGTEAKAALSRRLVSPQSDEGGSETQVEAQQHGKGRARGGRDEIRRGWMIGVLRKSGGRPPRSTTRSVLEYAV